MTVERKPEWVIRNTYAILRDHFDAPASGEHFFVTHYLTDPRPNRIWRFKNTVGVWCRFTSISWRVEMDARDLTAERQIRIIRTNNELKSLKRRYLEDIKRHPTEMNFTPA